jgi:hypothetical protein
MLSKPALFGRIESEKDIASINPNSRRQEKAKHGLSEQPHFKSASFGA